MYRGLLYIINWVMACLPIYMLLFAIDMHLWWYTLSPCLLSVLLFASTRYDTATMITLEPRTSPRRRAADMLEAFPIGHAIALYLSFYPAIYILFISILFTYILYIIYTCLFISWLIIYYLARLIVLVWLFMVLSLDY